MVDDIMLIKDVRKCRFFTSRDNTVLCELLHPAREDVGITQSIAYAVLKPGDASLRHRLRKSSEIYFILEGEGVMHIDIESEAVHKNQAVFIPPRSWQYIQNTGTADLKFLCIVNPSWNEDDEEIYDPKGVNA